MAFIMFIVKWNFSKENDVHLYVTFCFVEMINICDFTYSVCLTHTIFSIWVVWQIVTSGMTASSTTPGIRLYQTAWCDSSLGV